jgi:hypothetical protein
MIMIPIEYSFLFKTIYKIMKNFYEMIKILENEQIKTPAGYTLTPEELEEYENEKSPMYKSLFLKDIDAKRKTKKAAPDIKEPEIKDVKKPHDEVVTDKPGDASNHFSKEHYCFAIVNVIRHIQDRNYKKLYELAAFMNEKITSVRYKHFETTNQQIINILENSKDVDSAIQGIKIILERIGLKIKQKAGDRSKFNEEIHEIYLISCKEGEDIILKSDLIMFNNEVLFKAFALPINEYTLKNYDDLIDNPLKNLQPVHFK